jgi:acylphosphatase
MGELDKSMEWYRFIIFGKVQGVFYRKSVSQALMKRQFKGYIQNLPNGTVEVVAEVFDDEFELFMQILKDGSMLSSVKDIEYEIIDDATFNTDGFEVRY